MSVGVHAWMTTEYITKNHKYWLKGRDTVDTSSVFDNKAQRPDS